MKFFTPELFAAIQRASDEEAGALYEEWGRRCEQARLHFSDITDSLPAPFRRFAESVNLHDAACRVFDYAAEPAPGFVTINLLQARKAITLYYDLLDKPDRTQASEETTAPNDGRKHRGLVFDDQLTGEMEREPQETAPRSVWQTEGTPLWLYDEIDIVGDAADPSGFVHEILLSTGETLRLVFFGFDWHVHDISASLAAGVSAK